MCEVILGSFEEPSGGERRGEGGTPSARGVTRKISEQACWKCNNPLPNLRDTSYDLVYELVAANTWASQGGVYSLSHHCRREKCAVLWGLHVAPQTSWREEESRNLSWKLSLKIDDVSNFVCYLAYFS